MFDTLGGAGAGAGEKLTELLAQQFREQLLLRQQDEEERQARANEALVQERTAQDAAQHTAQMGLGRAQLDQNAAEARGRFELDAMTRTQPKAPPLPKIHLLPVKGPKGQKVTQAFSEDDPRLQEGVEAYEEPKAAPQGPQGSPQWVIGPDGQQAYRVPKPGDKRHDPVAERQEKPTSNAEAIDTAREAKRIAVALRNHKGLPGAFGVVDSMLPTFRQSTADAEELLKSLQGLLTLENTGKLKGVLSNADMLILRQASTTLASRISDSAARTELDRIAQVMGKLAGDEMTPAPAPANNDPLGIRRPQ